MVKKKKKKLGDDREKEKWGKKKEG